MKRPRKSDTRGSANAHPLLPNNGGGRIVPTHSMIISADILVAEIALVPECSGVYLFYLAGGTRILNQTGYFDTDSRVPDERSGRSHLYTGAANNLQLRMKQHLERDWRGSTFRKSLLAVEYQRRAISKSLTRYSAVTDEESLTKWLRANMTVELQFTERPFEREHSLINCLVSPFNIAWRRHHKYSRMLMKWRSAAFPPWRP